MTDEPPPQFGHFRVATRPDGKPWELGRGAMGVTYKAVDPQLRVDVALKVINPAQVGDAKAQALFLREARAAARVHHSNVANVVFLSQDPANPFFAMEFIAGESLRDWLRARVPLPPLLAIGLAEQIALGLEAIHAEKVIHRDLKPGNVMIIRTPRGRADGVSDTDPATWQVKIIDFGLARGVAGEAMTSNVDAMTTGFRGTAMYASPEQCQERADLDERSDLYSLGCILWEMLTGAPPFRGTSLHDLLTLHVSRPVPAELLAHLPGSVRAVVIRLLAKEPDERFANAAVLVEALERCRERILSGAEAIHSTGPQSQFETAVVPEAGGGGRPAAVPVEGSEVDGPPTSSRFRLLLSGVGVATAVALFVAMGTRAGWWRQNSPTGQSKAAPVPPAASIAFTPSTDPKVETLSDKSIAVLPFENLSSDKENAFFADGVQDQILTDLSRIADLRVTSRTSVMRYRGKGEMQMREIGKELGVIYILEGTVQRAGNKIRITAQLIDSRTDAHIWAEKYDRDLADVFAIQSELATAIAAQLKAKLTPAERVAIETSSTSNVAAYDLFLRAKALEQTDNSMMLPDTPENPRQALRLLGEAVALDPKFLSAYAMAVKVADKIAIGAKAEEQTEYRARAEANLAAALRLAPTAGETLLAQAYHYYYGPRDLGKAREYLGKALQVMPNNADAWALLGRVNNIEGKWDEVLDCYRRAQLLNPNDVKIIEEYSFVATDFRLYDLRIALCNRGASLTAPPLRWAFELRSAATEGHRSGDIQPIVRVRDRILAQNPGPRTEQELGEHPFAIAGSEGNVAEMERLAKMIPPPMDFEGRIDEAGRKIAIAQARHDREAVRSAAEAIIPEMEREMQKMANEQTNRSAGLSSNLGYFYALAGRREEGIRAGRRAMELMPLSRHFPAGFERLRTLAKIYALTGENTLALEQLEFLSTVPSGRALSNGDLVADSDWDALRTDPRFKAFLARVIPPPGSK